mmetsp:Transcript_7495/g.21932  ORF Transcript_7495/g.21932 Transcript_7495/m.21932 type:complete len:219 (-) Transcript_7495:182-838(-)
MLVIHSGVCSVPRAHSRAAAGTCRVYLCPLGVSVRIRGRLPGAVVARSRRWINAQGGKSPRVELPGLFEYPLLRSLEGEHAREAHAHLGLKRAGFVWDHLPASRVQEGQGSGQLLPGICVEPGFLCRRQRPARNSIPARAGALCCGGQDQVGQIHMRADGARPVAALHREADALRLQGYGFIDAPQSAHRERRVPGRLCMPLGVARLITEVHASKEHL